MKLLKLNLMFLFVFILGFIFIGKLQGDVVKADAAVKSDKQSVNLRAVVVNTNKEIKVPSKETVVNGVKVIRQNNSSSLSRGSSGRSDIVGYAAKFMGRPYVWGASGPSSFDCSGFTAYVYQAFGVYLDHYTGSQYGSGEAVSKGNLAPGDLVFFNTYASVSHVGIYIGGGQFIHASSGSNKVTVSNLGDSYYQQRYAGARRVIK